MSLEQGLVAELKADADVAALVGDRVYHEQLPESVTYPCIMYTRVSTAQDRQVTGISNMTQVQVQLDLMSLTTAEVKDLAVKVRALLNGLTGSMGSQAIHNCLLDNEIDSGFFDGDNEQHRVIADYTIWLDE